MNIRMAAVISVYGNEKNELLYLLNKKLEVKTFVYEAVSGTLQISEMEARNLLNKAISSGNIFTNSSKHRILQLLEKNGTWIEYIDNPDPEEQMAAVRNSRLALAKIKNPNRSAIILHLLNGDYNSSRLGYMQSDEEEFRKLTEEEICQVIKMKPAAMCGVPEELITQNMVYTFLESMLEHREEFLLGGFSNIPEKFRDYMFRLYFASSEAFNLGYFPEGEREQYIPENICEALRLHQYHPGYAYQLYMHLPEAQKTRENSIECIKAHPNCMSNLPKRLRKDDFYLELAEAGEDKQLSWLSHVDIATMSKNTFQFLALHYDIKSLPDKIPTTYFTEEICEKLIGCQNFVLPKMEFSACFWEKIARKGEAAKIPVNKMTAELVATLLRSRRYRVYTMIDEKWMTDEMWEMVIRERLYRKISELPEKYITAAVIEEAITNKIVSEFCEIPRQYRSEKNAELLMQYSPESFQRNAFPKEYQTKKICDNALSVCEYGSNSWYHVLSNCAYREKKDTLYAVENFSQAIELEDLDKEELDISVEKYPMNILRAPKWYVDQKNELVQQTANRMDGFPEISTCNWEKCEELSIFDFM